MKTFQFCFPTLLFMFFLTAGYTQAGGDTKQPEAMAEQKEPVSLPVSSDIPSTPRPKPDSIAATATLKALLTQLNVLNTQFEQVVYSVDGEEIQRTSGQLQAMRPGKVRWSTLPPMEQLVVSDSRTLWIYDPDLEQVTIKTFDQDISKTPAALFIGNLDSLEESYDIAQQIAQQIIQQESASTEQTKIMEFILTPKNTDSLYTQISLGFAENKPVFMSLWDTLEQKTHIVFQNLTLNQPLAPDVFQFIPPEGTDIIHDH